MLQQIHRMLLKTPLTRTVDRRITKMTKAALGCPDAFIDAAEIFRKYRIDAYLDIGAHNGLTIDRILEDTEIRIHAFEPTPASLEKLQKKYAGHPLVTLHDCAVSDRDGTANFFSNKNEQTNSLLDNDVGNERLPNGYAEHLASVTVKTRSLDSWVLENLGNVERIFVKCDVQGAEGMVVAGGMEVFRDRVVAFLGEAQLAPMYAGQATFFDLHKTLTEDLPFVLSNIYPCMRDSAGRALQTDALWLNERFFE